MDASEVHNDGNGGTWIVSWHPGQVVPSGTPHGAAGICVTRSGEIVLITPNIDRVRWDLPSGRPEGDETLEETLRREVREKACTEVVLEPWAPEYEIVARRCVAPAEARGLLAATWTGGLGELLGAILTAADIG